MRVAVLNNISGKHLLEMVPDAQIVKLEETPDVIFARSAKLEVTTLSRSVTAICRAGSGVNNIPIDWCNKHGVTVFNSPGANANAVKELVLWALISASRNTIQALQHLQEWKQDVEKIKSKYTGVELAGKGILVVGVGAVGCLVAKSCHDLGMTVYAYDPYAPSENFVNVTRIQSLENLPSCTYVSLHGSLTKETDKICNSLFLRGLANEVHLLNFARGELVDKVALRGGLITGKIKTYTSDFYEDELAREFPEKTIFLPHLGASTCEAEEMALTMVARQFANFWHSGAIENSVNFPACSPELPSGSVRLIVTNLNIPGMIADITKVIGVAGYNICYFLDKSPCGNGVGYNVIDLDNIDGQISKIIDAISCLSGVTKVRIIKK